MNEEKITAADLLTIMSNDTLGYTKSSLARAWKKRAEFGIYLIEDGQLGVVNLGGTEFIPKFEVERFLRHNLFYKVKNGRV